MLGDSPELLTDEICDLLDRERAALLRGDLDDVVRLMHLKEALIVRLNTLDFVHSGLLAPVRKRVDRNQTLLASALEGIAAVCERMNDLRRVQQGLATYDSRGRKNHVVTVARPRIEKRA